MKYIYSFIAITSLLSASLVGCTKTKDVNNVTIESSQEKESTTEEMKLVLMDNDTVKVTIINAYEDEIFGTFGYNVLVENKSNQDIAVMMENTSVNGFMEEPVFCANVTAGNKAQTNMEFFRDNQGAESLEELVNIQTKMYVCETTNFNTIIENEITINQ